MRGKYTKRARSKRIRNMRRKFKSNPYSRPTLIKRIGQQCRIGNSTVSGNPTATSNGNGSLTVGTAVADTLNTVQVGASLEFKLSSVEDSGDFTALFDRYKLLGVKLRFAYQANIANADSTTGSNSLPLINYSFDGDDSAVPTALTQVQRKQYCHQKICNGNYQFSVYIKPRMLNQVYQSAIATAYSSVKPAWIDATYPDVPHYGLKIWLNNWTPGATKINQLTIQPEYYLALKDSQ